MTTTAHTDATTPTEVPIALLAAHPSNPRRALGDLTELARSIRAHGVLQPLLVLPVNDDGVHLIIAGHRRLAASAEAGLERLPIVVHDLTESEVIEAMLIENTARDDLTVADEVAAIARLISLDGALTPNKLCKRIGKSQRWVRDRMTLTILQSRWIDALAAGELTLAQAVAAAGCADLGPELLDTLCAELTGASRWDTDATRTVERFRKRVRLDADEAAAITRLDAAGTAYFTGSNPPPQNARPLSTVGITPKAHATESCHAVWVQRDSWSDHINETPLCLNPRRHQPRPDGTTASEVVAERPRANNVDDSHVKRRARVGRLAAGVELFARRRGGPTSSELMVLALQSLIDHASHDAAKYAATMLGLDGPRPHQALATHAATGPAGLAQAAGALACGQAEVETYHSTNRSVVAWYRLLIDHGWQPDDWTAGRLARATPDTDTADRPDADDGDGAGEYDDDEADGDEDDSDEDDSELDE